MESLPLDHHDLRTVIENAGLRCTPQRLAVYDHLSQSDQHPTAEDVYQSVRSQVPKISLATVYKALEALVDVGVATKLTAGLGGTRSRYDARRDLHYHFRCLESGTVHDLPTRFDPDLIKKLDPRLYEDLSRQGYEVNRIPIRTGWISENAARRRDGIQRVRARSANGFQPGRLKPWSSGRDQVMSTFATHHDGPLIDTHAHLSDPRLKNDLAGVLARAGAAGIVQIVAIGSTAVTSAQSVELAEAHRGLFAAVGIHPNDAAEASQDDWAVIETFVERPGVVAVGETGLDRYWDRTPFPQQQEWFERHLCLARERDLPVIIHCRDCQNDIIAQLSSLNRSIRGIMHAFTGTWQEAQVYLKLGLHLSFAGMVTFTNKNLDALRDVAARVPLDRILVETDSPYLSPHPWRGQTNEPARVAATATRIAEIKGLSSAEFARITTANARELFRIGDASLGPSDLRTDRQ